MNPCSFRVGSSFIIPSRNQGLEVPWFRESEACMQCQQKMHRFWKLQRPRKHWRFFASILKASYLSSNPFWLCSIPYVNVDSCRDGAKLHVNHFSRYAKPISNRQFCLESLLRKKEKEKTFENDLPRVMVVIPLFIIDSKASDCNRVSCSFRVQACSGGVWMLLARFVWCRWRIKKQKGQPPLNWQSLFSKPCKCNAMQQYRECHVNVWVSKTPHIRRKPRWSQPCQTWSWSATWRGSSATLAFWIFVIPIYQAPLISQ